MRSFHLTTLAVLASVASLAPAQDSNANTQGDEAARDYTFRTAPLNARGTESLADLRGTPTLIEYWGVR